MNILIVNLLKIVTVGGLRYIFPPYKVNLKSFSPYFSSFKLKNLKAEEFLTLDYPFFKSRIVHFNVLEIKNLRHIKRDIWPITI